MEGQKSVEKIKIISIYQNWFQNIVNGYLYVEPRKLSSGFSEL